MCTVAHISRKPEDNRYLGILIMRILNVNFVAYLQFVCVSDVDLGKFVDDLVLSERPKY